MSTKAITHVTAICIGVVVCMICAVVSNWWLSTGANLTRSSLAGAVAFSTGIPAAVLWFLSAVVEGITDWDFQRGEEIPKLFALVAGLSDAMGESAVFNMWAAIWTGVSVGAAAISALPG
jgi:hypothetical protein